MLIARKQIELIKPATEYISLARAKQHLRVLHSNDDAYITDLLSGAFAIASKYVGYSLLKSKWQYGFDYLVGQEAITNLKQGFTIPNGNYLRVFSRIISIDALKYVDENNVLQSFASGDWLVKPVLMSDYGNSIYIVNNPTSLTDDNIRYIVEITEGFEVADFPKSIEIAVLQLVQQYYDNRQAIVVGVSQTEMSYNFEYILDPFRIPNFV